MTDFHRYPFVIALYPNARGFGFALFESALSIADWGVKEVRGLRKNAQALAKAEALFAQYAPRVLVMQDMAAEGARRVRRIRTLNHSIAEAAVSVGIRVARYSRADVLDAFVEFGATTKQGVAEVIAEHIPTLSRYVPPPRKPWQSEDARMGIFDAAALALTFFHRGGNSEQGIG